MHTTVPHGNREAAAAAAERMPAATAPAGQAERIRDEIDRRLIPVLRDLVAGRPAREADLDVLAAAIRDDPVRQVFAPAAGPQSTRSAAVEDAKLVRMVWETFAPWWRSYFPGAVDLDRPMADLWRLYLPLAQWIVRERRRRRPDGLFVVGFNGSPGAGKTVLTNALATVLDRLLDPRADGRAVARSGDDWYLGKRDREPLRSRGYDPGRPTVTNRSLPGTHDLAWLERNLGEMERSTPGSRIRMGDFDKRADEQAPGPGFEVRGRVGVFLFDLWFAGAETDVDPALLPAGLRREVAVHLAHWRAVFARLDALWAFGWPPFEQMVRDREAQELLVARRRGTRGMDGEDIRAFMSYMIEQGWDWRTTSPVAPDRAVTFHARRDGGHRVVELRKGGRAQ
ncbi:MAG TPA: hypothetical protein VGS97_21330 [Actinocrinis sp.]|uniref:hypothetical protein n=1 Tax=Actinocrinis sp. TaxID=1920516 RepID=UPI002DDD159A|nr:hypothetical protein [Actinocrinis sp.]HEV2346657.1 hypothetical protein [Actinocrinis sp.]